MTKVLITGSSGHLGEALAITLHNLGREFIGIDIVPGRFTKHVGSIIDRSFVKSCMTGVQTVFHSATLHKPHIATHSRQDFIDTNVTGTLNLLEEAVEARVNSFVYTSTTSVFGDAMSPPAGAPAVWVTEDLVPIPKNIYGVTKMAAEDLCQMFHRNNGLSCIVLRTSRFFPEDDDNKDIRQTFSSENMKLNEFLYRRVEIEDVVSAHLLAAEKAQGIGFGRYIVSATTPFSLEDLSELRSDAPSVVRRIVPDYQKEYVRHGWKMMQDIDRVYVNQRIRNDLGWQPQHDFKSQIVRLATGKDPRSPLAIAIGSKGYHSGMFSDGPYPIDGQA